MRRRVGDLAVIVGGDVPKHIGLTVRVLRPYKPVFDWEWIIELRDGEWAASDRHLRPIRDPGDDAVDEMVQKLGKPEGVPA